MNKFVWGCHVVVILIVAACGTPESHSAGNTLFKMGFKSKGHATGPLYNTFFFFKLNDTVPPLLLTAHHVVAGNMNDDTYLAWDSLEGKIPDAWLWGTQDTAYQMPLGKNLPVPHAKTLHKDIAAYYLPEKHGEVMCLKPASRPAIVGDTVNLFTRLKVGDHFQMENPGIVVYAVDSMVVYELMSNESIQMAGTSGSPVLNRQREVISNSFGGLIIPHAEALEEIAKSFPPVKDIPVKIGKTYGIGLPIKMIEQSLYEALTRESLEKQKTR